MSNDLIESLSSASESNCMYKATFLSIPNMISSAIAYISSTDWNKDAKKNKLKIEIKGMTFSKWKWIIRLCCALKVSFSYCVGLDLNLN